MSSAPPILNIHTPTSSFAIVHSVNQESLQTLFDKLSRKANTDYYGERVGPNWLKYEYNGTVWNLDDDSDYTIFGWRQQVMSSPSTSTNPPPDTALSSGTPTLHLHNPNQSLPIPPAFRNPSYYLFQPSRTHPPKSPSVSPRPPSNSSHRTKASKNATALADHGTPRYKKEFEKFHGENGVRTVMGSIGPVKNVRMLLKSGYRHVYISRKFALKHGFIPADAAPGHYGYGGLVNIGTWPITLAPSSSFTSHPDAPPAPPSHLNVTSNERSKKSREYSSPKHTMISVYLSEEPHFDVVLGRSFFERRQIRTNPLDQTDVVCMDTGEKIECELVILKDGKGEIVTVT